LGVEQVISL